MRQFDIVELSGKELAVILQSDLIEDRLTRVVAPLLPKNKIMPTHRLHPIIRVKRRDYILATEQLSAITKSEVRSVFGSAANQEYEIRRAIDIVFMGV